jgi:POT family proton-dependent oligopeptide transporter
MSEYKTAPVSSSSIPSGIPFIVVNEAAERFSYYGMRAILVVFMTQYLMNSTGQLDVMSENEAQG